MSQTCPEPKVASDSQFHPGQVWEYKTRPGEKASTLTILKVESIPKLGVIIHIRVDKVRLRNCTGGPGPDEFAHMPFSREALEKSATKLAGKVSVPDFRDGYERWRKDCGGVLTITVAEAIAASEAAYRNGLGCPGAKL